MDNSIEYKLNYTIVNFCDTLENKIFNFTNIIAYKIIFSIYNIYINLISNKAKIITENDILKNVEFEKNKYNKELMLEVIDKLRIFGNEINIIGKNEIRLSLEIEKDVVNLLRNSVKNAMKHDKDKEVDKETDEEIYEETDEESDDDNGESYSIDIIYSDESAPLKGCYNIDLNERYSKGLFPMHIKSPFL